MWSYSRWFHFDGHRRLIPLVLVPWTVPESCPQGAPRFTKPPAAPSTVFVIVMYVNVGESQQNNKKEQGSHHDEVYGHIGQSSVLRWWSILTVWRNIICVILAGPAVAEVVAHAKSCSCLEPVPSGCTLLSIGLPTSARPICSGLSVLLFLNALEILVTCNRQQNIDLTAIICRLLPKCAISIRVFPFSSPWLWLFHVAMHITGHRVHSNSDFQLYPDKYNPDYFVIGQTHISVELLCCASVWLRSGFF